MKTKSFVLSPAKAGFIVQHCSNFKCRIVNMIAGRNNETSVDINGVEKDIDGLITYMNNSFD